MTNSDGQTTHSARASEWLAEQATEQRDVLLILDPLAEPDPIQQLFGAGMADEYANLYLDTELADLSSVSPWLARLRDDHCGLLSELLDNPERNWGWLASVSRFDLNTLVQHWRDRMLIEDEAQRALYRFQDNRVITHHLTQLTQDQRPLLMGPLVSALCWSGDTWTAFNNPDPASYPQPFSTPWLEINEPLAVANQVRHHNLRQWLWQDYPAETAELAEKISLDTWLEEQLTQAERWQWQSPEHIRFLLRNTLIPKLASHPAWSVQVGETPEQHFQRCYTAIGSLGHLRS